MEISEARQPEDLDAVRELFREYQEALGVDLSFQGFESEVESLPGAYAPPRGRLLLARDEVRIAGCVALRPLAEETCEMKRLYVRPKSRASGLGGRLVERVIAEARAVGYTRIVLDTLPIMAGAQRLYERFGFQDIAAYRYNPIMGSRFLGLDLSQAESVPSRPARDAILGSGLVGCGESEVDLSTNYKARLYEGFGRRE